MKPLEPLRLEDRAPRLEPTVPPSVVGSPVGCNLLAVRVDGPAAGAVAITDVTVGFALGHTLGHVMTAGFNGSSNVEPMKSALVYQEAKEARLAQ